MKPHTQPNMKLNMTDTPTEPKIYTMTRDDLATWLYSVTRAECSFIQIASHCLSVAANDTVSPERRSAIVEAASEALDACRRMSTERARLDSLLYPSN